ncbi:MAG: hypothetical protein A2268_14355 [Candidatus Raymondbacteria bacterium RifOxyA12_full_50_37]|uniref:Biopolymer transporter ExbD n=1 Tax=Candidatus Raymondbacteria bacterium RIFOXYD12_FULL_49_13 TaxID=1817890 RepID=A0A1F7FLE3_UNCRA|nr:MAG: hypothetical protein A2268_14355 [Candidatus Raymondbacteria bacterium RifOxyA12_full_50_37]OGJ86940.1 MAG: hypothetical protein A2350_02270 [Candidatus Raymondbacteria bacterium RifOxyB12_full_50_8]OGJ88262.1 MAG: hypothetical protein A2248_19695 [Candidatus Raymondbacteria bacterium RIFOXYA2_FULL_49_16]OGK07306.1 MAG: hypothetical protein A2519_14370 [Candidatus Raymondbacteria bacterium RIFOXYD12_FULL_49_13]OGK08043.1 MAG: hypothetical protein A2487_10435 [Candidatus Raymondbacteria 
MSFPASKTSRKKVKKNHRSEVKTAKPQLTSLVDIMTILLVFLLKSFSAEGDIMTPAEGLKLPESTAKKKPEQALRISLAQDHLMVEGQIVLSMAQLAANEDQLIPELEQVLQQRRNTTEKIAEQSTKVEFKGEVIIEADRKIHFSVLQKIMYTCGQVGFSNFSLLVLKKE